jgi:hypothetical protein
MKLVIVFIVVNMFLVFDLFSQIGIKTGLSIADNTNTQQDLFVDNQDIKVFRGNYSFGLSYQYIFEGTGMSLIPGITYSYSETGLNEGKLTLNRVGFDLPFKLFPFNMEGDCNCPDFSMRNKFIEKHFFLLLNTGVNYSFKRNSILENAGLKDINFKAGLGTGISFSVLKNIILSPAINYNWFFSDNWNKTIINALPDKDFSNRFSELEFEVRIVYKVKSR